MNSKRWLLVVLAAVLLAGLSVSGFSVNGALYADQPTKLTGTEEPTEAAVEPTEEAPAEPIPTPIVTGKRWNIAVVVKLTGISWFDAMNKGITRAAEELGVDAYMTGPDKPDPALQVKVVEDLIAKGVDAIAVVPNDAKSLEPAFKKAKDKGIIVLTHESPDQIGNDYDLELIDNVKFGQRNFDMLVKYMGDSGKIGVYVGGLTVPLHNLWADEGLKYAAEKYPNIVQVGDREPVSEDVALARQKTLDMIKAYPDLKGIVAFGSQGPIGAAQAVKEKGLSDKIIVVGTVLPSQAAPYLKDGSLKYGSLWSPADAGYGMVWLARYILDGNKVVDGIEIPGMGKATLNDRVVLFDAMMDITADNVDQLIADTGL